MKRGMLTPEVLEKAKDLLNVGKFSQVELRLMPYVQYTIMNGGKLEREKLNNEEREVLKDWEVKNWIDLNQLEIRVTKPFFDAMNELLWLTYVDHD